MDKLEIMKIANHIDTYNISILPYEDCCTIFTPPNPSTKPKREKASRFEGFVDFESLLQEAIEQTETILIQAAEDKVVEEFKELF
jgi:thiamine biosynthesis protein ThiI